MAEAPQVGDRLAEVVHGPITRGDLALFAGASGDHVFLHIDSDYARAAGFDDVFAHGMLSMAWLAQVLTRAFAPEAILDWSVRFLSIVPLGATVRSTGEIVAIDAAGIATIALAAEADGVPTLSGTARIAFSSPE